MDCPYPNCPSGQNEKLLNERHSEIKTHLQNLEQGQERMIGTMTNVAMLLAKVNHIEEDIKQNREDHNAIFSRLRRVENKVVWIVGGMAGIVSVIQILKAIGVIK